MKTTEILEELVNIYNESPTRNPEYGTLDIRTDYKELLGLNESTKAIVTVAVLTRHPDFIDTIVFKYVHNSNKSLSFAEQKAVYETLSYKIIQDMLSVGVSNALRLSRSLNTKT
jgi:hypothetical protein